MSRGSSRVAAGLIVSLMGAVACSACGPTSGSGNAAAKPPDASLPAVLETPSLPPTPWSLAGGPAPTRMRLLLDQSLSIKGYVRSPTETWYRMLTVIEQSALTQGIVSFEAAGFDAAISAVKPINGPTALLKWPTAATSTCLSAPLASSVEQDATGKTDQQTVFAIITDGVPSAGDQCSCPDTLSVTCISKGILAAIAGGYGVWVLGAPAEFDGMYYPELAQSAGAAKAPFPYKGTRPLYMWVLTRKLSIGRGLAAAFLNGKLKDARALEVWPGDWSGHHMRSVQAASQFNLATTESCGDPSAAPPIDKIGIGDLHGNPLLQVTMKKRSATSAVNWSGSLPAEAYKSMADPAKALVTVTGQLPALTSGGRLQRPHDGRTDAGCYRLNGGRAVWTSTWTATAVTGLMDDWSTATDATIGTAGRTLLLSETWAAVAAMLQGRYAQIELPVVQIDIY